MIEDREEQYLHYRFGFDDDIEHPPTGAAKHFHHIKLGMSPNIKRP